MNLDSPTLDYYAPPTSTRSAWKRGVILGLFAIALIAAATIGFALLACLYLYGTARWQGRDLSAKEQDESMYLIQTQMLARGHLWMPQHPCADFFESFHVLVRPVYAGMYFPGTALAYAPS